MIRVCAIEAVNKLAWLSIWRLTVKEQILKDGPLSQMKPDDVLEFVKAWGAIKEFCKTFELKGSLARAEQFSYVLRENVPANNIVESEIEGLEVAINEELNNRFCAFVPSEKIQFFEQKMLFGDAVFSAFPEAREEIKDAGNCLVADLNTAAVFHLMRVAEVGLRKLAKPFKIKLPHQIEYATWGTVLNAIQTELDKKGVRRSPVKEEKLKRYSHLLLEIKAFQHLWRNPVSHLRGSYDPLQAESAFNHVRAFMQNLAEETLGLRRVN